MNAYLKGVAGMRQIEQQRAVERRTYNPDYLPHLAASGITISLRLAPQVPHRHTSPNTGRKVIVNNLRWFLSGHVVADSSKSALIAQDADGNEIPNFFQPRK